MGSKAKYLPKRGVTTYVGTDACYPEIQDPEQKKWFKEQVKITYREGARRLASGSYDEGRKLEVRKYARDFWAREYANCENNKPFNCRASAAFKHLGLMAAKFKNLYDLSLSRLQELKNQQRKFIAGNRRRAAVIRKAVTECPWVAMKNVLAGSASKGKEKAYTLQEAKTRCLQLAQVCTAVTCREGSTRCSVRTGPLRPWIGTTSFVPTKSCYEVGPLAFQDEFKEFEAEVAEGENWGTRPGYKYR